MTVGTPEELVSRFEAAYNARDKTALMRLYAPEAVHTFDGTVVSTGLSAISAAFDRGFASPYTLSGTVLSCLEADGVALIRALWKSINPDGSVRHESISCEVARKGPDGLWRYLIDDATGGSRRIDATSSTPAGHQNGKPT